MTRPVTAAAACKTADERHTPFNFARPRVLELVVTTPQCAEFAGKGSGRRGCDGGNGRGRPRSGLHQLLTSREYQNCLACPGSIGVEQFRRSAVVGGLHPMVRRIEETANEPTHGRDGFDAEPAQSGPRCGCQTLLSTNCQPFGSGRTSPGFWCQAERSLCARASSLPPNGQRRSVESVAIAPGIGPHRQPLKATRRAPCSYQSEPADYVALAGLEQSHEPGPI